MNYVIFDLEWNNAYSYKTHTGMNEIIEIGALKLDEDLRIVDSFKQLIRPRLSKKLSGRFKDLTHITAEEIKENGVDFDEAFRDFARWSDYKNSIFMSWSDSDLYVLISNYRFFKHVTTIPFIEKYADVQKYCMRFMTNREGNNQVGLAHCAEYFQISVEEDNLHRALEDCYVASKCFKTVFDEKIFSEYVCDCSGDYFERLVYKPYYISKPVAEGFNIKNETFLCPKCSSRLSIIKPFEFYNNTFRNYGVCTKCGVKYWVTLRAKQMYDHITITKKVLPMNRKRAKRIDRAETAAVKEKNC